MIYCVWYPSGGFGHFVNAVLSLYGDNFVRPQGALEFSASGNSHRLDIVVPKYYQDCWPYEFEFDQNKNYSVLIDNGINNESDNFKSKFPAAKSIKICYTEWSWPVVARALIDKAMNSNIESELSVNNWDTDEPWARREKYFLFLRDHPLKCAWQPEDENFISVDHLFEYNQFHSKLSKVVEIAPFEEVWTQWRVANSKYIDPVETARVAMQHIRLRRRFDLHHVTDVWDQAVIYYYFWSCFGIEVPHNDFANWINSTDQLAALL